jgi:hypothetical protein
MLSNSEDEAGESGTVKSRIKTKREGGKSKTGSPVKNMMASEETLN